MTTRHVTMTYKESNMPVKKIKDKEGRVIGHQYGDSGKKYYGKDSQRKAAVQGYAIEQSKREKK